MGWTVKNVSGRLLVGLRWWQEDVEDPVTGEEISEWKFEARSDETQLDMMDKNIFWIGTYSWALIWTLFLIKNLLSLSVSWLVLIVVADVFAITNLIGFWRCSQDQRKQL